MKLGPALATAALFLVPLTAHSDAPPVVELIPRAQVKFDSPAGWTRVAAGDWIRFKPKDEFARLGFVTFDQPGEATRRIGQIAGQFELSNMTWGGAADSLIGKGQFPAHSAVSTSCNMLNGHPCRLWYATVNPGGSEQILIVHLVDMAKGGEKHQPAINTSLNSLRRM